MNGDCCLFSSFKGNIVLMITDGSLTQTVLYSCQICIDMGKISCSTPGCIQIWYYLVPFLFFALFSIRLTMGENVLRQIKRVRPATNLYHTSNNNKHAFMCSRLGNASPCLLPPFLKHFSTLYDFWNVSFSFSYWMIFITWKINLG